MASTSVAPTELFQQDAFELRHSSGAQATVLRYGGQVVSYRSAEGHELLYCSPLATTEQGAAVRGGVPVIFPQFDRRGPLGDVPRHGFARTAEFSLGATEADGVTLVLRDDERTRATFPFAFRLALQVILGPSALTLRLHVDNMSTAAMPFTCALHTYLRVADVHEASIHGLSGHRFEDKVSCSRGVEDRDELRIEGEVDRIYGGVQALQLRTPECRVDIGQQGFEDAVVWNPGPKLAAGMADLPNDDYRRMLCLEAANALHPVTLAPGERFEGVQTLTLVPL